MTRKRKSRAAVPAPVPARGGFEAFLVAAESATARSSITDSLAPVRVVATDPDPRAWLVFDPVLDSHEALAAWLDRRAAIQSLVVIPSVGRAQIERKRALAVAATAVGEAVSALARLGAEGVLGELVTSWTLALEGVRAGIAGVGTPRVRGLRPQSIADAVVVDLLELGLTRPQIVGFLKEHPRRWGFTRPPTTRALGEREARAHGRRPPRR